MRNVNEEVAMPVVMVGSYLPKICETVDSRKNFIKEHENKSRILTSIAGMTKDAELRRVKDSGNRVWFYAVDLVENDLLYIMHLNPLRMKFSNDVAVTDSISRFAMYQGSVWRAEGNVTKLGDQVPKYLFWRLFKGRNNWFSDSIQSLDGKRFWERRIREAKDQGFHVYAVHFREPAGIYVDRIVPLSIGDDLQRYWTYEYKKDESGMYWRFAIVHP
jgi:hypothetical protein